MSAPAHTPDDRLQQYDDNFAESDREDSVHKELRGIAANLMRQRDELLALAHEVVDCDETAVSPNCERHLGRSQRLELLASRARAAIAKVRP